MPNGTESEDNKSAENDGLIEEWEALEPRNRTERSIVERVFQRILEDMRVFQKNKTSPEED